MHNNPLESVKQYTLNIDITNPSNRFNKQNKNFARAAHFFVGFFFPVIHDYDAKLPELTFYGGGNLNETTNSALSPQEFNSGEIYLNLRFHASRNNREVYQKKPPFLKESRRKSLFYSDVFAAFAVVVAKAP